MNGFGLGPQLTTTTYRLSTELAVQTLDATGAHVYWLEGAHLRREIKPQNHPDRIDALNKLGTEAVVVDLDYVSVAPYKEFIGELGSSREKQIRDDGVHLTEQGLSEIAEWLMTEIISKETNS